jgi:hypothetical protein
MRDQLQLLIAEKECREFRIPRQQSAIAGNSAFLLSNQQLQAIPHSFSAISNCRQFRIPSQQSAIAGPRRTA